MPGTKQDRRKDGMGRRELLKSGGFLAAGAFLDDTGAVAQTAGGAAPSGQNVYEALGVRPLINCKGTFTIITGSLTLPEVKQAMDQASRNFVNLDELMEAVGKRLAGLTGAEWGIVTAGCAAAITAATCACIAGGSPEKMQRLPQLQGLKDEVIVPKWSRNVYDHAVRMLGVRIVTVDNLASLEEAFGPRTAMVYILAGPDDTGPFGLEPITKVAAQHGVPVFVDAAAENLTPDVHFKRGADLVGYSGGKALRGPQCAGLLLGRKDLCRAAWINSAPHHAFGRSLKVGKEEIVGMLTAVEMWYRRDHKAEWQTWESWLGEVATAVEHVQGVTTEIVKPDSLSNSTPSLRVKWDGTRLGKSGEEVFRALLDGNPRIQLHSSTGSRRAGIEKSSVLVVAWMMQPGEAAIVAAKLREALASPRSAPAAPPRPGHAPADVSGRWNAEIHYVRGTEAHAVFLEQKEGRLSGTHYGETLTGPVTGWVEGNEVEFRSTQPYEGTTLEFVFHGKASGNTMEGVIDLGEYGSAAWKATRGQPGLDA